MEFNAFTAGVNPGGLLNHNDIRLLLCYLLKSVNAPLSRHMILSVIQDSGLANYFEAAAALEELREAGSLTLEQDGEDPLYRIAPQGLLVADTLSSQLPVTVRERSVATALALMLRAKREQENKVTFEKLENGVFVRCHISDGDSDMMLLELRVPDLLQADLVKQRFQRDPGAIYSALLALLTGDAHLLNELKEQLKEEEG